VLLAVTRQPQVPCHANHPHLIACLLVMLLPLHVLWVLAVLLLHLALLLVVCQQQQVHCLLQHLVVLLRVPLAPLLLLLRLHPLVRPVLLLQLQALALQQARQL
jgi:hypothetical protein